jgi:hypothetical protein
MKNGGRIVLISVLNLRAINLWQVNFRMALWHFVDTAWVQHRTFV